jgi:hypothetical protein
MKPDFSGEYVLDRPASTLSAAGAASVESARIRIEHQEPRFRSQFEYIFANGQTFEGSFDLTADEGPALRWDGDALVFRHSSDGTTMTFRYELIGPGGRLRMFEELRGTDHDQDNIWIFERQ